MNENLNAQRSALNAPACLRGWIVATYTTYKGKRLGPYYSRTWKVNGKIKREYIKPADVERVRAACQANRESRKRGVQIAADFHNTVGNLKWLKKMAKRSEKNDLRPEDYDHLDRIQAHGYSTPGRTKLRSARSKTFASQYPTPNTQHLNAESSFMYPSVAKHSSALSTQLSALRKSLKQEVNRSFASKFAHETTEEKWERWRNENANRPTPRLPKPHVDLCVPEDHVDSMAEKLAARLDQSIANEKKAPDWRNRHLPLFIEHDPEEEARLERPRNPVITPRNFPWEMTPFNRPDLFNRPNSPYAWNPEAAGDQSNDSNMPNSLEEPNDLDHSNNVDQSNSVDQHDISNPTYVTYPTYSSDHAKPPYMSNRSYGSYNDHSNNGANERPFSDQLRDFRGAHEK